MNLYLSLPILFLKFWFIEAPIGLVNYLFSLNHAALQILSLPLMVRTFFKPLKNEYRKGLVGFSLVMGILVKTTFILTDLILFGFLLFFEFSLIALFVLWPFIAVYILFI